MASFLIGKKISPSFLWSTLLLLILLIQECSSNAFISGSRKVHIVYMGERQHDDPSHTEDSHHEMLSGILGSKEDARDSILYSYKHGFSGFAARLTKSQARQMAELPDVVKVMPNYIYKLHTTRSWDYLGLPTNSPNSVLSKTNMGDGVIIGVLDTGIWPESQSFNDEGLGPVPSRWKGTCETGELFNLTNCNRKLIGARWFMKGIVADMGMPLNTTNFEYISPRDANGHGTHTSATAAGSLVANASYNGLASGSARGGAPQARLATYKVCWNVSGGSCAFADILKAFDEAIHDGVNILSLSLGPTVPLLSDVDEMNGIATGSFHAVTKGITVVCSAGNSGPSAQTVANVAPWIITVAASTMDRAFPTLITLGNNQTIMGQGIYTGNKEIGFTGLVFSRNHSSCSFITPNDTSIAGKVVLCFTDRPAFAASIVKAAGGVGVIIAKNPNSLMTSCSGIPCIHVDYQIGTQIGFYIASTRWPTVKLNPSRTLIGKPASTKIAYFSSRGPNSIAPAILKPDIAAPGVNILAASPPNDQTRTEGIFSLLSGTSMSCPHVSGITALLKSAHPDWSPASIRSALVTTASATGESGEPIFAVGDPQKLADPFDYGGGIVNPNKAADPGLVYDMGTTDYIHYLCAMGYNSSSISRLTQQTTICPSNRPSLLDVNLPSITIPSLRMFVVVSRTVTNVGPVNSTYNASIEPPNGVQVSVRPQVLVFNPTTKKLSFTVTFSATKQLHGGYYFGSLSWSDGVHVVRSPISVRNEIIPSYVDEY